MNLVVKLIVFLIITLEASFIHNIGFNGLVIIGSVLYIGTRSIQVKSKLYLLFVPLLPAIGISLSQLMWGNGGLPFAEIMFTRIYVYVGLGADFVISTSVEQLLSTLEQNFKLPSRFTYGIWGAIHLIPDLSRKIKTIRTAALMRGVKLHFWSPKLYFKAILAAINESNHLAEAMLSHGFVENAPRTHAVTYHLMISDWLKGLILLGLVQIPLVI